VTALDRSLYGALAGTPMFMARECLTGGGARAASDQFAFCVALYQALWGRHPFGLSGKVAVHTVLRGDTPTRPRRGRIPARVWRLVAQGLSHDPDGRHASMTVLLDALEDDPAARWRRRGLVGVAVVGSAVAIAWSRREPQCVDLDGPVRAAWNDGSRAAVGDAFSATKQPWAETTAKQVAVSLDAWGAAWAAEAGEACADTRIRGTQSEQLLDRRTACLDLQRRKFAALVDVLATADVATAERATDAVAALPDPVACSDPAALARGVPRPTEPAAVDRLQQAEQEVARGFALYETGSFRDARRAAEAALGHAEAAGYTPAEAEAARLLGDALDELGDREGSVAPLRRSIAAAMAGRDDAAVARAWLSLGHVELARGDLQSAADCEQLASGAAAALATPEPFRVDLLRLRGKIALARGEIDAGRKALDEALAALRASEDDRSRLAAHELTIGNTLFTGGDYEASRAHLAEARDLFTEQLGAEHPYTLRARGNLANVLTTLRDLDAALAEHEAVLAVRERVLGPDHIEVGSSLTGLANIHYYRDEPEKALALAQRAMALFEAALGPDAEETRIVSENTAAMLAGLGRYEEALALSERILATIERAKGGDHPDLVGPLTQIANTLRDLGRTEDSLPPLLRAIAIVERKLGKGHPHLVQLLGDRAGMAARSGDGGSARADLERAIGIGERVFGPDSVRLAEPLRALADLVEPERAAELGARADRIDPP
jgi:serine/threonine-protein kinase